MKKFKIYSAICISYIALLATAIIGIKDPNFSFSAFRVKAEESYNCNAITYGAVVNENFDTQKGSFKYIESESTLVYGTSFDFTYVQCCSHPRYSVGPILVGGATKYGELNIDLMGLECSRVKVYAATHSGEGTGELIVNEVSQKIHSTIDNNYDFTIDYNYEFNKKSIINIKTVGTNRVFISKIVFRTH